MKVNQKGFSVVEILVVIVIVGLLGAVGWLVYDRQQNKKSDSQTNTQVSQKTPEKSDATDQTQSKKSENQTTDTVSSDIVVCNVNPSAQSGAGLKVAFYGYVKGDYTKVWVEYGSAADSLNKKTVEYPNNGEDNCNELLASMPASDLSSGKYFYRVVASKADGTVVHSKTDTFTIE
jgi:prepilin-type N-terminal cleavage/methylation domain-containing protein